MLADKLNEFIFLNFSNDDDIINDSEFLFFNIKNAMTNLIIFFSFSSIISKNSF